MSKPIEYASTAYHALGTACHAVINTTLKTKVENKVSYSLFSMPVTRKLYAAAGQSTLYKVFLTASLILPLVALLEFTVGNLGYLTIGNLLTILKKKISEPSYKWSGVKIGIAAASIAALVGGVYAYKWLVPAENNSSIERTEQFLSDNLPSAITQYPTLITTTVGMFAILATFFKCCCSKKNSSFR